MPPSRISSLAVALVAAALIAAGCGSGSSEAGDLATDDPPRAVSVEELAAAVEPAVAALLEAPAFEATWVTISQDRVAGSLWVVYRSDGDFEVLRHTDPGVISAIASLRTSLPEGSTDSPVEVSALVAVDGVAFQGDEDTPWETMSVATDLTPPSGIVLALGIDLAAMAEGEYLDVDGAAEVEATVQDTGDGGAIWTLSKTDEEGTLRHSWGLHPDGHLRSYRLDFPGVGTEPLFTGEAEFTLLANSPEITAPEVGMPVDLARFDVPSGLPLPR